MGAETRGRRGWCMPAPRVLSLVGGLALVAAYYMPWFGMQGIVLTGSFLGQLLGSTNDLRRFLPGASGGASEVQLLRGLVYLFPVTGAIAAAVALAAAVWQRGWSVFNAALMLLGVVPLVAVMVGTSRLPSGAGLEVGVWLIAAGSGAVILGAVADALLGRRGRAGSVAEP